MMLRRSGIYGWDRKGIRRALMSSQPCSAVQVSKNFVPSMNFATDFLMKGTPWEWEYAPMEPISASSS